MSFDLYAWKEPRVADEDEADAVVKRYYGKRRMNPEVCTPHADIVRFYDELLARYPGLEQDSETELNDSPWAMTPPPSDRMIEMHLRFGGSGEPLDAIVELARKYDLVLYDPQGPSIHSPALESEPEDIAGQAWSAARASVVAIVLIVAGWFMPWWFIGWPMTAIGLFIIALAIYTFVVLFVRPDWGED